ncbi:MAG: formate dehydrogenase subunit gamma [Magnetospiraceae bacterium]
MGGLMVGAQVLRLLTVLLLLCIAIPPAAAQTSGNPPGNSLGNTSDSQFWRDIRRGNVGNVSIPDQQAAVLVQSEGDNWRAWRNGPVSTYGAWFLGGVLVALALFFLIRGRIRVDAGLSGRLVRRFTGLERLGHWLTAGAFIILALTGLNLLFGKYVLMPVIGKSAFAAVTLVGKYLHHGAGFAFMAGLGLISLLWAKDNIWDRYDFGWILKGGGLLVKGKHPPARKFNFGQKTQFWVVILVGVALSSSGLALMFPFEVTDLLGQQIVQIAHVVLALLNIGAIFGHIYIGTIGMEAAASAMTSGYVDYNWVKEHHSVWVKEQEQAGTLVEQEPTLGDAQPAE